jgi:HSP20 family protein
MNIVRFNPWRELDRVESNRFTPAVDVWETPDAFRIDMDIPAVDPSAVDVSVEEGVLVISGERSRPERGTEDTGHRFERRHGSFNRRFKLPDNVDEQNIVARVVSGVLEVTIAKRAELAPRRIEVGAA